MSDILLSVGLQTGSTETSQIQTDLQRIISQIDKNPPKVKVGLQVDQSAINHFKSQLTQIVNGIGLSSGAPITVNISGIGEISAKADSAKKAIDGVTKAAKDASSATSNLGEKQNSALQSVNSTLRSMQENYRRWAAAQNTSANGQYATYGQQIEALEALKQQVVSNTITYEQFTQSFENIKVASGDAATEIVKHVREYNEYQKAASACAKEIDALRVQQEKWTAAKSGNSSASYDELGQYQKDLEDLLASLQNGSITLEEFKRKFSAMSTGIGRARTIIKNAGEDTKSFSDRMEGLAKKFGSWLTVSQVIMQALRAAKQMVKSVTDVDAAITELKKVTDETDAVYSRFLKNASIRAKQVGASLSDIVTASADFARLGYGIDEASKLADASIIYKNIGDGIEDVATASESIISTMQAFGIEASNAMSIVDKFNEVGNNFAISSAGIGEAMQRSAAAMASANNSIDETIALIAAANTIVQNPESVGTTLKTVSMYLRAAKTEAEEAGESTDGMAGSVSELRQEILDLTGQKVDIQIDDDTFKSTYQILKELSQVWGNLSDISQANLLELIGGKRNANVVSALLENFSVAEDAMKSSMGSAGSAIAENEKHLDSINGKIEKLKASFESFSVNIIDSSFIKIIVDIGAGLLNVLDALQQIHVLAPLVAASFATIAGVKNMSTLTETMSKVGTITNSVVNSMKEQGKVSDILSMSVASLTSKEKALLVSQIEAAVASGTITSAEANQTMATLGLASAEGTLVIANKGLAASFKSLMAAIPIWGWIALAITTVIEVVSALTDEISKNKQEMIDSANEAIDAYSNANDTYRSNISSLEDLRNRFEQLSQGVDENGENVSLTADEYSEYLSLVQQICNISPSVVEAYDKQGKAVVDYTNLLNDAIDSQKEQLTNDRNIYLGKGKDIFDGKAEEYRQAQEDLKKASAEMGDAFNASGFLDALLNADEVEAKSKAYRNAFEQLGIDFKIGTDTWTSSLDAVIQMYEKHDQIIALLAASGAYTQDELNAISNSIYGIAGAYTQLNSIEAQQVDYLMEWAKDKQWYSYIPISALDELRAGLIGVNDPLKSFSENLSAADAYGQAFYSALSSESVRSVIDMSKGLADGSVSLKKYNLAVADLKNNWNQNADVMPLVIAYLYSLTNGYSSVSAAAKSATNEASTFSRVVSLDVFDGIDDVQSSITALSEALSNLNNGTLGVEEVFNLIRQFPELAEYVDLTADNFGNLDKGLKNLIKSAPEKFIKSLQQFKRANNLVGDAATQVDNLCELINNMSVDAIRDASGEFGVLADSINAATKAQNNLEAVLAGDDWDAGYEDRVEAFENFQETLNAGEYGSKAYSAYKDYFIRDDLDLDASGVKEWMEKNQKYFTEGSDGVLLFMETVEQLGKQNEKFRNIASFDSRTGEFVYDIHQLDAFAKELGWTEEMLQDFIYKYRMYCEEWTSRSAQDNYTEFKNAGLIFEKGDKTLASLDGLLKYTNLSKEEIYNLIDAINELRRSEGSDPIEVIEPGQIQITQGLVNHLMGLYGSADLVEEKLREMVRGLEESDYTVEAGLKVNGKDVQKMLKGEEGSFVEVNIKMNVNNEEVVAAVRTTAADIEAILGKDWAVKLNGEDVENVDEHLGNIFTLLMQLPGSTDVTITDSTETVRTNLSEVDNYLGSIASRSKQEIVITYSEQGRPIQQNATGTKRAKRGPSLLGDEYSPNGSPKPELVVSGDRAYIAGMNGPEIGYLNDGDIVYTADETKRILRGNTLHKSFQAHAGGTAGDWIGLSGGRYSHSGKGHSSGGKSDDENWFERQYKDHNHWIEMDKENMADYLDWLDDAYKRAYDEGIIDIDEYYKYEEEVLKKTQDLFKDHLNDIDHEISLLEDNAGSSDEIINLTLQAIVDIEKELAAARAAGLDENGDYIQYLEQQWADYSQTVIDMREDAESEIKSSIDDLVEYRIDMLKQEIEDQKDALNEKLDDLQEFYDKQREMLQDKYDEEKYLEEQNEKRKSVSDIREELSMLEFDNSAWAQKRKLELQEELAEAEKELESFEKDHALDMTLDMLDKQQEDQEAEIRAQIDALDEKLNDPHALFNQALEDIKNNTAELYQEFIQYNRKHGSGNDQDIADMWEEAYKADLEYQDTHNGEHLDGIAIGNYTGYVVPDAVDPPQPDPEQQQPNTEQDAANEPAKTYPYGRASDTNGDIGVGSNGEKVKAIQYALNELGFGNAGTKECHGMFGPDTKRAVQAFQRAMGISADGIVGNNTRAKFKAQGYALGTKSATYGIHEVEELGTEYIFESPSDGSRYRMFHGGEKVLNADATNFLYDFATSGGGILMKMLSDLFGLSNFGNISKPVQAIEIHSGDIIVHGNANERTVSEIRRAQRENLEFVIREFNQLNK